jgi:hypothetical protein
MSIMRPVKTNAIKPSCALSPNMSKHKTAGRKPAKKTAVKKPRKVTPSDVLFWIGETWNMADVAAILAEVANGEYKPAELFDDVDALRE